MALVFGVPVEEVQRGIRSGVGKINIDTDIRLTVLAEGAGQSLLWSLLWAGFRQLPIHLSRDATSATWAN